MATQMAHIKQNPEAPPRLSRTKSVITIIPCQFKHFNMIFTPQVIYQYNCTCFYEIWINTLRLRQHGHHFPDDIFECIFVNENVWISIKFSLNIVPDGLINNIPALVQIMAWWRLGDKPLPEPMKVFLLTHICVTRPQWVNKWIIIIISYLFLFVPNKQTHMNFYRN